MGRASNMIRYLRHTHVSSEGEETPLRLECEYRFHDGSLEVIWAQLEDGSPFTGVLDGDRIKADFIKEYQQEIQWDSLQEPEEP